MQTQSKPQLTDLQALREKLRERGITQNRLARELDRSQGAIARALKGERKTLLGRIVRWLDRYERRRQGRAA